MTGKAPPTVSFRTAVYAVVSRIPPGRVMTYGQVALCVGMPRAARVVGGALHLLDHETDVPWHRVVNRHGTISTRCPERSMWVQAERLRAEGAAVDDTLTLDLARYRWVPHRALLADLHLAPEVLRAVDALLARAEPAEGQRGSRPPRTPRPRRRDGSRGPDGTTDADLY
ncbi:MAG TPA: MGMT family protein [Chloroflexota bacterium]|jgi:methylated-DNA-protein-cysteine methyltransferase-like protein